jgi:hypothetical protein
MGFYFQWYNPSIQSKMVADGGDNLLIYRVAVNILNKQLSTAN